MNKSVIAGGASKELATKISRKIKGSLVHSKIRVFEDGESKITLLGKVSKNKAIVVQSLYPPVDSNLIQALSLVSKARETASSVTAVIPYMGYARQDREFLPGEVVTMKVLGRLFAGAGATEVITVDIHSVVGLRHYTIKTRNVSAVPKLVQYFKRLHLRDPLVVSPDQGGTHRAAEFAKELGTRYIALEKKRDRKTGRIQIKKKNIDVARRDLILIDDIISTGGSIIKATGFLKKHGCKKVYVACTHALLIDDAAKKIKKAGVTKIVSTNTVPGKTSVVDVSGIIAKAIG